MKNQRKNIRLDCTVPVEGKEGSSFDRTKTIDFSKGGLGFISGKEIPVNQEIAVEIDLGEYDEPVIVIGRVKWVHPDPDTNKFRVGMSFDDMLKGSKSRLSKYFKAH